MIYLILKYNQVFFKRFLSRFFTTSLYADFRISGFFYKVRIPYVENTDCIGTNIFITRLSYNDGNNCLSPNFNSWGSYHNEWIPIYLWNEYTLQIIFNRNNRLQFIHVWYVGLFARVAWLETWIMFELFLAKIINLVSEHSVKFLNSFRIYLLEFW